MKSLFILAGGQRCGTSWLYQRLDEHPEIYMAKPRKPEPKYFLSPSPDKQKYIEKYFSGADDRLCGEKSTSYYETSGIAERIASFFPEAKIVFIFRNPVDRAISNYHFSRDNGLEIRTIEEVFLHEAPAPKRIIDTSVNPFDYLGRGFYSRFLNNYIHVFGRDQICVLGFEEVTADPSRLQVLYSFLGISDIPASPQALSKVNQSSALFEVSDKVRGKLYALYEEEIARMTQYIDVKYWK